MSVSLLDLASFRIVSGASVFWPVLTRLSELTLVINIRGVPHNDIHLSGDEHPVKSDRLVGFLCSNARPLLFREYCNFIAAEVNLKMEIKIKCSNVKTVAKISRVRFQVRAV